ncbi:MAG: hypothetical protein ACRD2C_20245 [Acidimicrobiales bacterium]
MTLRDLHDGFAWLVVVANALAGGWALAAHWLDALRRRELWWLTVAAQVSIFVQVALGVAVVAREDIEVPDFHAFYGFVALATVGIIYSYRQQLATRRFLLYGLGGLFLMGLAIRSMVIGPR